MKRALIGFFSDVRYRKISHSSTVNDLLKEFFRKTIHICASLVPILADWHYQWTLMALTFIVCFYSFCEYRRLSGHPIPVISTITAYAARTRDEGRFVLGPVTMGLGVLSALILFPPEAARIGIFALAFGDGIASLAGKIFGKTRIPFTKGKTAEGSTACFFAVFFSTVLITHKPLQALEVALLAAVIEVFPIQDYDNLLIPLAIGGFVFLLP